ncbi:hypothetical protein Y1Q_0015006 [Alligator mississippiensis]|uniref:Uncharacterized protein n=1 Tax=Alligator mississippiensis TaxID=8496 RepID=A0A151N8U2_ALLMI|nr:hypothetical protein Y1Q_0015006 [Alligator mississippiensis]
MPAVKESSSSSSGSGVLSCPDPTRPDPALKIWNGAGNSWLSISLAHQEIPTVLIDWSMQVTVGICYQ